MIYRRGSKPEVLDEFVDILKKFNSKHNNFFKIATVANSTLLSRLSGRGARLGDIIAELQTLSTRSYSPNISTILTRLNSASSGPPSRALSTTHPGPSSNTDAIVGHINTGFGQADSILEDIERLEGRLHDADSSVIQSLSQARARLLAIKSAATREFVDSLVLGYLTAGYLTNASATLTRVQTRIVELQALRDPDGGSVNFAYGIEADLRQRAVEHHNLMLSSTASEDQIRASLAELEIHVAEQTARINNSLSEWGVEFKLDGDEYSYNLEANLSALDENRGNVAAYEMPQLFLKDEFYNKIIENLKRVAGVEPQAENGLISLRSDDINQFIIFNIEAHRRSKPAGSSVGDYFDWLAGEDVFGDLKRGSFEELSGSIGTLLEPIAKFAEDMDELSRINNDIVAIIARFEDLQPTPVRAPETAPVDDTLEQPTVVDVTESVSMMDLSGVRPGTGTLPSTSVSGYVPGVYTATFGDLPSNIRSLILDSDSSSSVIIGEVGATGTVRDSAALLGNRTVLPVYTSYGTGDILTTDTTGLSISNESPDLLTSLSRGGEEELRNYLLYGTTTHYDDIEMPRGIDDAAMNPRIGDIVSGAFSGDPPSVQFRFQLTDGSNDVVTPASAGDVIASVYNDKFSRSIDGLRLGESDSSGTHAIDSSLRVSLENPNPARGRADSVGLLVHRDVGFFNLEPHSITVSFTNRMLDGTQVGDDNPFGMSISLAFEATMTRARPDSPDDLAEWSVVSGDVVSAKISDRERRLEELTNEANAALEGTNPNMSQEDIVAAMPNDIRTAAETSGRTVQDVIAIYEEELLWIRRNGPDIVRNTDLLAEHIRGNMASLGSYGSIPIQTHIRYSLDHNAMPIRGIQQHGYRPESMTYTVSEGDTLTGILERYNIVRRPRGMGDDEYKELLVSYAGMVARRNEIDDPNVISVGQELLINIVDGGWVRANAIEYSVESGAGVRRPVASGEEGGRAIDERISDYESRASQRIRDFEEELRINRERINEWDVINDRNANSVIDEITSQNQTPSDKILFMLNSSGNSDLKRGITGIEQHVGRFPNYYKQFQARLGAFISGESTTTANRFDDGIYDLGVDDYVELTGRTGSFTGPDTQFGFGELDAPALGDMKKHQFSEGIPRIGGGNVFRYLAQDSFYSFLQVASDPVSVLSSANPPSFWIEYLTAIEILPSSGDVNRLDLADYYSLWRNELEKIAEEYWPRFLNDQRSIEIAYNRHLNPDESMRRPEELSSNHVESSYSAFLDENPRPVASAPSTVSSARADVQNTLEAYRNAFNSAQHPGRADQSIANLIDSNTRSGRPWYEGMDDREYNTALMARSHSEIQRHQELFIDSGVIAESLSSDNIIYFSSPGQSNGVWKYLFDDGTGAKIRVNPDRSIDIEIGRASDYMNLGLERLVSDISEPSELFRLIPDRTISLSGQTISVRRVRVTEISSGHLYRYFTTNGNHEYFYFKTSGNVLSGDIPNDILPQIEELSLRLSAVPDATNFFTGNLTGRSSVNFGIGITNIWRDGVGDNIAASVAPPSGTLGTTFRENSEGRHLMNKGDKGRTATTHLHARTYGVGRFDGVPWIRELIMQTDDVFLPQDSLVGLAATGEIVVFPDSSGSSVRLGDVARYNSSDVGMPPRVFGQRTVVVSEYRDGELFSSTSGIGGRRSLGGESLYEDAARWNADFLEAYNSAVTSARRRIKGEGRLYELRQRAVFESMQDWVKENPPPSSFPRQLINYNYRNVTAAEFDEGYKLEAQRAGERAAGLQGPERDRLVAVGLLDYIKKFVGDSANLDIESLGRSSWPNPAEIENPEKLMVEVDRLKDAVMEILRNDESLPASRIYTDFGGGQAIAKSEPILDNLERILSTDVISEATRGEEANLVAQNTSAVIRALFGGLDENIAPFGSSNLPAEGLLTGTPDIGLNPPFPINIDPSHPRAAEYRSQGLLSMIQDSIAAMERRVQSGQFEPSRGREIIGRLQTVESNLEQLRDYHKTARDAGSSGDELPQIQDLRLSWMVEFPDGSKIGLDDLDDPRLLEIFPVNPINLAMRGDQAISNYNQSIAINELLRAAVEIKIGYYYGRATATQSILLNGEFSWNSITSETKSARFFYETGLPPKRDDFGSDLGAYNAAIDSWESNVLRRRGGEGNNLTADSYLELLGIRLRLERGRFSHARYLGEILGDPPGQHSAGSLENSLNALIRNADGNDPGSGGTAMTRDLENLIPEADFNANSPWFLSDNTQSVSSVNSSDLSTGRLKDLYRLMDHIDRQTAYSDRARADMLETRFLDGYDPQAGRWTRALGPEGGVKLRGIITSTSPEDAPPFDFESIEISSTDILIGMAESILRRDSTRSQAAGKVSPNELTMSNLFMIDVSNAHRDGMRDHFRALLEGRSEEEVDGLIKQIAGRVPGALGLIKGTMAAGWRVTGGAIEGYFNWADRRWGAELSKNLDRSSWDTVLAENPNRGWRLLPGSGTAVRGIIWTRKNITTWPPMSQFVQRGAMSQMSMPRRALAGATPIMRLWQAAAIVCYINRLFEHWWPGVRAGGLPDIDASGALDAVTPDSSDLIPGGDARNSGSEADDHIDRRGTRIRMLNQLTSLASDDAIPSPSPPRGMGTDIGREEWAHKSTRDFEYHHVFTNLITCWGPEGFGEGTDAIWFMLKLAALGLSEEEAYRDCIEDWFMQPEIRSIMTMRRGGDSNWGGDQGAPLEDLDQTRGPKMTEENDGFITDSPLRTPMRAIGLTSDYQNDVPQNIIDDIIVAIRNHQGRVELADNGAYGPTSLETSGDMDYLVNMIMNIIWPESPVPESEAQNYVFPVSVIHNDGFTLGSEARLDAYWNRPQWGEDGRSFSSQYHHIMGTPEVTGAGGSPSGAVQAMRYYRNYIAQSIPQMIICIAADASDKILFKYGQLQHAPGFVAQGDPQREAYLLAGDAEVILGATTDSQSALPGSVAEPVKTEATPGTGTPGSSAGSSVELPN